jgi:hypothetical protein
MAHKEQNRERNDAPGTPDMSKKRDGVTSAFSAATSRSYSGEDIKSTASDSGNDTDKMRSGRQENKDESKLFND